VSQIQFTGVAPLYSLEVGRKFRKLETLARPIERHLIPGSAGHLEALLEEPGDGEAIEAALSNALRCSKTEDRESKQLRS
jgi:hypothetical protein